MTVNKVKYNLMKTMKSDIAKVCIFFYVCQLSSKPIQVIPRPLKPMPVIGEPFDCILIDWDGPLPKTESGNSYLLTLMCVSIRYHLKLMQLFK